ncbi:hypothetical protein EUX98_g1948 [Antrodiella citrinella]|uniref:FAD/NAD(P)-binding domain-containing protein n=1 Tax=Antrodiella citrinella TaxID=2447956 RepID=A0A4S4N370_9APHY|nr:hypothetical protein EUX98_g1948 [Antrodiella citrinella]
MDVATLWFSEYAEAVAAGTPRDIVKAFLPHGWFRDVLTLTWNYRALEGPEKITRYLSEHLHPGQISGFKLLGGADDTSRYRVPKYVAQTGMVEVYFAYETDVALGKGYAMLKQDESAAWKALNVCMMIVELKGHEEPGYEVYDGHTLAWSDVYRERNASIEADPHVLIDTHFPFEVLYQPYPSNWPFFIPKDKLADWHKSHPIYHDDKANWDVTINRDGQQVTIHPAHIIVATGTLGKPADFTLPFQDHFSGTILHGSKYQGGAPYTGKRVIVVGAGNSSIDICQDLCFHNTKSVTMIQRSSTCVHSSAFVEENQTRIWPDGEPVEVGDFKLGAVGPGLSKKIMQGKTAEMWERDKEMHDKLRKGGFALNMGVGGGGQVSLVWERGGGFWVDKGGADLIGSGAIKVKQGAQPTSYTETGLVFSDGTELEADVVIFA